VLKSNISLFKQAQADRQEEEKNRKPLIDKQKQEEAVSGH
jgi:hypothetical protein